jgi:glycosyltransferase involved in cell wall biosynthesis
MVKMKNKKILFVLAKATSGGSCTSMLNLLELLKQRGDNIDLFLMSHEGLFLNRAKLVSNLIPQNYLIASIVTDINLLLKHKSFFKLFVRILYIILHKTFGIDKITSLFYKISANELSDKYDFVVAYQESMTTRYVQYIKAKKKIAWVHTDFDKFVSNKQESKVYDAYDSIVAVSNSVRESIIKNIPNATSKTELIYNSLVTNKIINESKINFENLKSVDGTIILVSVGRFSKAKGFERIVEIGNKMIADNIKFLWYVVGDGELWDSVKSKVIINRLENNIILLGNLENPYPIIKAADFMVVTSFYEAHPMVVNEALILHKPVITTFFNSVKEIIEHGKTGVICENSVDSLYDGIKAMIFNNELRVTIQKNVNDFQYSNSVILDKINKIFND